MRVLMLRQHAPGFSVDMPYCNLISVKQAGSKAGHEFLCGN